MAWKTQPLKRRLQPTVWWQPLLARQLRSHVYSMQTHRAWGVCMLLLMIPHTLDQVYAQGAQERWRASRGQAVTYRLL